MRERMLAGDLYLADDPELVAERLRCAQLLERYNRTRAGAESRLRAILGELLGSMGAGAALVPPFRCDYGFQLHLGARTFANFGLVALDVARITIGEDVQLGPNVQLLTAAHPVDPGPRREKWERGLPISIGDNAWLGGGVVVGPGVSIGADSVVGAGSVVVRDIPAGVVAVGNPARVLREL